MNKTIVIGLDGFTPHLLKQFKQEDIMPSLTRASDKGVYSRMDSVVPTNSAAAWSSFQTGNYPGKHNIYDFMTYEGDLTGSRVVNSRDIRSKTFFEILDDADYQCNLVNLPLSSPARIDGDLIFSWMSASESKTQPKSLAIDLGMEDFPMFISNYKRATDICGNSIEFLEKREGPIKNFYDRDWDFYFHLFSVPDWIQHLRYDQLPEPESNEIYNNIDDLISHYLAKAEDENYNVFIISDHGFATYHQVFYLNQWLKDRGYLEETNKSSIQDMRSDNTLLKYITSHPLLKELSFKTFELLRGALPFSPEVKQRIEKELSPNIDIHNSQAFCPSTGVRGIFINDSRFTGLVDDEDKEEMINELVSELRDSDFLTDIYRSTLYPDSDRFSPDILFKDFNYKVYDSLTGKVTSNVKTNQHDFEGILIAFGPDIKQAEFTQKPELIDIAPTLLKMYGMTVPEDMDGRCLEEIL